MWCIPKKSLAWYDPLTPRCTKHSSTNCTKCPSPQTFYKVYTCLYHALKRLCARPGAFYTAKVSKSLWPQAAKKFEWLSFTPELFLGSTVGLSPQRAIAAMMAVEDGGIVLGATTSSSSASHRALTASHSHIYLESLLQKERPRFGGAAEANAFED